MDNNNLLEKSEILIAPIKENSFLSITKQKLNQHDLYKSKSLIYKSSGANSSKTNKSNSKPQTDASTSFSSLSYKSKNQIFIPKVINYESFLDEIPLHHQQESLFQKKSILPNLFVKKMPKAPLRDLLDSGQSAHNQACLNQQFNNTDKLHGYILADNYQKRLFYFNEQNETYQLRQRQLSSRFRTKRSIYQTKYSIQPSSAFNITDSLPNFLLKNKLN